MPMAGVGQLLAEIERMRALLAEQEAALAQREAQLAQKEATIAEQSEQIAALKEANELLAQKLELLRHKLFGRKNERYTGNEAIEAQQVPQTPAPPPRLPRPEPDADTEQPQTKPGKEGNKPKRRNLEQLDELPLREMPCPRDKDAVCEGCGGELTDIGAVVSWRLEWVAGHFERIRVCRDKCVCKNCPEQGVLVAPEPSFAIRYGLPGNGLLAKVGVDKFADRITLNLQKERFARIGVPISTSTLSGWVKQTADYVRPIALAIHARLMRGSWLQGDDTGFPVQDGTDGQLRKGRLWAYTDQQEVAYQFTDDKSGRGPADFLSEFAGHLLLFDGGSEFNLASRELDITRGGCWSHLRRYFFDARHYHPLEAHLALGTIRDLFELEASCWGGPPEVIREVRSRDAKPLVDGLFEWIRGMSKTVRPSSLLGEAVRYALNQESKLRTFLSHPELPMHNNRSELSLRGPVVGRKAWLFAGSQGGAEAAATMFTLMGSCMLQGIDPYAYLFDVLNRLADHPASRVEELTPLRWRLAREA